MSLYLNKNNDSFKKNLKSKIYVDKSLLIKETNDVFGSDSCFMCITRPRRFGKTYALSMLNAYYSKGCNSKELFDDLNISKNHSYLEHLNKHNVIWIDMASLYTGLNDKTIFVKKLKEFIYLDLKNTYKNIDLDFDLSDGTFLANSIKMINSELNERFIFLIDEWDILYREQENNVKLCDEYTEFLRNLFKSSDVASCIDLVYMTGILPIRRYSTQSTLNMFTEYNMVRSRGLESYVGFTQDEVKKLCDKYNRDFELIKKWYDGYNLKGIDIYNPKSVVEAVLSGECLDYWIQTSSIEALTDYMNYDNGVLKDNITRMLTGEKVEVNVTRFANDLTKVNSTDAALTVLIYLGYLAYDEETCSCYIPNYEIRLEFVNALQELKWNEIYNPISNSKKLYEETLKGNTNYIDEILDKNHNELASMYNKNKEDVLSVIVQISYYYTKQFYNIKKEDTSTKGRADLTFIPYDNTHIPMIIELKIDTSSKDAIKQINNRQYFDSLGNYKGDVLLIGISYNSKTLKHSSKVETITLVK